MDSIRFDRLARALAHNRLDRRAVLTGGSLGVAGALVGSVAARAQGTPTAGNDMSAVAEDNATLFVQTAAGGTFLPNTPASPASTEHGTHLLTLAGHPGQTIGFSDRPQRNFGQLATPAFLESLGFTSDNPPNAALVVSTLAGEDDILVLELLNPTYDAAGQLLIYEANILGEYAGEVLAPVADRQQDQELASEFDHASLFIDDCADWTIACRDTHCNVVGDLGSHGMCWNWSAFECQPCGSSWAAMAQACNANFSDCQGQCNTATCGGMVL
jgi:hypothetical protein